jgi:hypothetical protein
MQDERIFSVRERELLASLLQNTKAAADGNAAVTLAIGRAVGETVAQRAFAVLGSSIVDRILETAPTAPEGTRPIATVAGPQPPAKIVPPAGPQPPAQVPPGPQPPASPQPPSKLPPVPQPPAGPQPPPGTKGHTYKKHHTETQSGEAIAVLDAGEILRAPCWMNF